jgi:hypothetical protein
MDILTIISPLWSILWMDYKALKRKPPGGDSPLALQPRGIGSTHKCVVSFALVSQLPWPALRGDTCEAHATPIESTSNRWPGWRTRVRSLIPLNFIYGVGHRSRSSPHIHSNEKRSFTFLKENKCQTSGERPLI